MDILALSYNIKFLTLCGKNIGCNTSKVANTGINLALGYYELIKAISLFE